MQQIINGESFTSSMSSCFIHCLDTRSPPIWRYSWLVHMHSCVSAEGNILPIWNGNRWMGVIKIRQTSSDSHQCTHSNIGTSWHSNNRKQDKEEQRSKRVAFETCCAWWREWVKKMCVVTFLRVIPVRIQQGQCYSPWNFMSSQSAWSVSPVTTIFAWCPPPLPLCCWCRGCF